MKNIVFSLLLVFAICSSAYSVTEFWPSFGLSYGNYFEKNDYSGDMYTGSLGLNVNTYVFNNEGSLGLFVNYGLLIPITCSQENYFKPFLQIDFILGLGYRFNINERFIMHLGLGPNISIAFLENKVDRDNIFDEGNTRIGFGGDIGIKYNISNSLFFDAGILLQYNFLCYREARNNGINYWGKNYSLFGLKPYIAIGFNRAR